MTLKPSIELLHVVLIYNGLGNITIVAFSEFILYQSIVLGLIDVTYIGLMCNHIFIHNTYSRKRLMFSELNKTQRWAWVHSLLFSVTIETTPVDSSIILVGQLNIVSTPSIYREQNVKHSSTMYPSTIDPSGAALFRT